MDYLHLIYEVPAIVAGSTMLAYLWPKKILPHFVPLLMFIVALIVFALPAYVDVALAVTPLVAIIQKLLGLSLTEHEPVKVPDLKEIRARIKPPKIELRQFVTRAYPARPPDDVPAESEASDDVPAKDDAGDTSEEPAQKTSAKSFIPPL